MVDSIHRIAEESARVELLFEVGGLDSQKLIFNIVHKRWIEGHCRGGEDSFLFKSFEHHLGVFFSFRFVASVMGSLDMQVQTDVAAVLLFAGWIRANEILGDIFCFPPFLFGWLRSYKFEPVLPLLP